MLIAINSTHNVKENLTNVNSVQKFTNVVLEEKERTNISGLIGPSMCLLLKIKNIKYTNV